MEKNITSKYTLRGQLYHHLREDSRFHCKYIYPAVFSAAAKLKMYRRRVKSNPDAKLPRFLKNHFILYPETCKVEDGLLRIPTMPKNFVFIKLTRYVLNKIKDAKIARFTITDDKIIISYYEVISGQQPSNFVGIDRNLDNVTTVDSQGNLAVYDISQADKIIASYTRVKRKFRRNDSRIKKRIFQKYGKLQKNRIHDILNKTSKKITSKQKGIVMENLKGIRKLFRRANGKGRKYRRRLNSWSFYELQRQIEYKARWQGLPVKYVRAGGTSSKCAICGSKLVPEEHRQMFCPSCWRVVDRDVNAAHNILLRGTRVVPDGATGEAVMAELGIKQPVICRVDAAKSGNVGKSLTN